MHEVCLHICTCVTCNQTSGYRRIPALGPPRSLPSQHFLKNFFKNYKHTLYNGPLPVHDTVVLPMGTKCHCLELDLLITSFSHDSHCNPYKPTPVFPGCRGVRKIPLLVVWSLFMYLHSFINYLLSVHMAVGPVLRKTLSYHS